LNNFILIHKKKIIVIFAFLSGAAIASIISFSTLRKLDLQYQSDFKRAYRVFAIDIPNDLNFAGEQVPIKNFEVRENIDREFLINTYWQSQSILFLKRSNRWFKIIEPILKRNNIPNDFKYLALIESGLTNATSNAGAVGFWQFMEPTAKQYGLEVNEEVDERYNIEKSTQAACNFFNEAYKTYNNWTMVAAAFNMGSNGLNKQVDIQKVSNYYDLLLNSETSRYVFRILAAKEIMSKPKKYGFYIRKSDLYPSIPTHTVTVDSTIVDFTDFATKNEINYKVLKIFNPWLRKPNLSNKDRNKYFIKIPNKGFEDYDYLTNNYNETQLENTEDSLKFYTEKDSLTNPKNQVRIN